MKYELAAEQTMKDLEKTLSADLAVALKESLSKSPKTSSSTIGNQRKRCCWIPR
jgi:hypothetical protein